MLTLVISTAFFLMIAAPCVVALRSTHKSDENEARDEAEAREREAIAAAAKKAAILARPLTLREMADEAEAHAEAAQEAARAAHWAALAAEAGAARLRADAAAEAAAEAGRKTQKAIRAAAATMAGDYLPETHPSLDFPRSRVARRRAA